MTMRRETLEYDVLIVGAGPAGLAAAIRLGQLARDKGQTLRLAILEKGASVGSHILSGAIIDPCGLDELLPDWRHSGGFAFTPVDEEHHLLLNGETASPFPAMLLPPMLRQQGCIMASLGDICHWLGQEAEALGVDVCSGFAAVAPIIENGALTGVFTGDMGRDRTSQPKADFSPGAVIRARYTLIAEGACGSLSKQLEAAFDLARVPQKYALGLKELWQLPIENQRPGLALHASGWPLAPETQGGIFLYHLPGGLAAVGLVAHLDYPNPYLSPFEEFQRAKHHPALLEHLHGGRRLGFGARAIACGGLQSIPELTFPGGALLGCSAGLLNPARGKGIHSAMISGIAAAEAAFSAGLEQRQHDILFDYTDALTDSVLWDELVATRNFKPWLSRAKGMGKFIAGAGLWAARFGLSTPWTLQHHHADHETLRPARESSPIDYPPADGLISFDRASSLQAAGVSHEENQPCHLQLKRPELAIEASMKRYASPETRYCPAGVYTLETVDNLPQLRIQASNCLHCKACAIKDPARNIVWSPPEGGGGPNYRSM